MSGATQKDVVRWMQYVDATTGSEVLLAGCLPAYDPDTSGNPHLIGVVCMDINMILPLDMLTKRARYSEFRTYISQLSETCMHVEYSEVQMQLLRASTSVSHKCEECDMGNIPCPKPVPQETKDVLDSGSALLALAAVALLS